MLVQGDAELPAYKCRTVGSIIGWSSSGFYLGSRLSQIWKNHSRQSAEGLSLAMFACAITANVCYALGILIRAYSWQAVRSSAPWILGSLGTVSLDLIIFTQVVEKRAFGMHLVHFFCHAAQYMLAQQFTCVLTHTTSRRSALQN